MQFMVFSKSNGIYGILGNRMIKYNKKSKTAYIKYNNIFCEVKPIKIISFEKGIKMLKNIHQFVDSYIYDSQSTIELDKIKYLVMKYIESGGDSKWIKN